MQVHVVHAWPRKYVVALVQLITQGDFQSRVEAEEPSEPVIFCELSTWGALSCCPWIHFIYHLPAEESTNRMCYKIKHFNLF